MCPSNTLDRKKQPHSTLIFFLRLEVERRSKLRELAIGFFSWASVSARSFADP
jgi:hypothetical protein